MLRNTNTGEIEFRGDRLNILLVDDDERLAISTAKLLQRYGQCQVKVTDRPTEFFEQCESNEIDVVLLDINLPEARWEEQPVSGADLARMLKEKSHTAHIPIILLTAYALASERQTLLQISQADDLCIKPVLDYQDLLARMHQLVTRSRMAQSQDQHHDREI
ncbi:response regulator [Leptolyngbya sp. AN03gr2]|uniref:response regulator n=1 Tax=unclassified Leptolyngbya TaxID=2650499 RepID=UPI003D317540